MIGMVFGKLKNKKIYVFVFFLVYVINVLNWFEYILLNKFVKRMRYKF